MTTYSKLRIFSRRYDDACALSIGDQGSLEGDITHVTNIQSRHSVPRRQDVRGLVLGHRLAGEASFVDGQLVHVEQAKISGHTVANYEIHLKHG